VKAAFSGEAAEELMDYLSSCARLVLSKKQWSCGESLFMAIDRDESGIIDMDELDAVLRTSTGKIFDILTKLIGYGSVNRRQFLQFLANVKLADGNDMLEAVIAQLATSARAALSEEEEAEVTELYQLMDANGDSTLECHELKFMLRHSKGAVVKDLLKQVDSLKGYLSMDEFMAACSFIKLKRGSVSFRGILDYLRKQTTDGVAEDVLIAELESGWGDNLGGPSKPPAILVSVLRPALVAKLGRPELKQLYVKKIHATGKVGSAAAQNLTVNPESKLWAGNMSIYCGQMWHMHPEKGIEMGDSLLHVAARALNHSAVRFLVDSGLELSRKNSAGLTPYECVVGASAGAQLTRAEFDQDWVQRFQALGKERAAPEEVLTFDTEEAAEEAEDDFFAAIQEAFPSSPSDPKDDLRRRNAAIRAARDEERRKALGLDLPSAVVAAPKPVATAQVPASPLPVSSRPQHASPARSLGGSASSAKVAQVMTGLRSELAKSTVSPGLQPSSKRTPSPARAKKKKINGTVRDSEAWKSRLAKENAACQGSSSGRRVYRYAHQ